MAALAAMDRSGIAASALVVGLARYLHPATDSVGGLEPGWGVLSTADYFNLHE